MKLNFPHRSFKTHTIKNCCYDRPQNRPQLFYQSKVGSSIIHNDDKSSQGEAEQSLMVNIIIINDIQHVYMRPEVNSNRIEIPSCFKMSLRLHGNFAVKRSNRFQKLLRSQVDFNVTTFQTIVRHKRFQLMLHLLIQNRCCGIVCFLNNYSNAHVHQLSTLMILLNFISLREFTVYKKKLR